MAATPYHHGDLRNALLREAQRVLETDGPDAITLRGLARRLGVSHAAPGHHFPDRAALLRAVATEGFRALYTALQASQDARPERPADALRWAYVEFALDHPRLFRLMFDETVEHTEDDECWAVADRAFALLADVAGSNGARRAGHRSLDARTLRLWSLMHGAAMLYIDGALAPMLSGPRARQRFRRTFLQSLALEDDGS